MLEATRSVAMTVSCTSGAVIENTFMYFFVIPSSAVFALLVKHRQRLILPLYDSDALL
jgi:hypothetical protein